MLVWWYIYIFILGKQHGWGIFIHPFEGKKYAYWEAGKRTKVINESEVEEIKRITEEIKRIMAESNFKDIEKFIFNTEKSIKITQNTKEKIWEIKYSSNVFF